MGIIQNCQKIKGIIEELERQLYTLQSYLFSTPRFSKIIFGFKLSKDRTVMLERFLVIIMSVLRKIEELTLLIDFQYTAIDPIFFEYPGNAKTSRRYTYQSKKIIIRINKKINRIKELLYRLKIDVSDNKAIHYELREQLRECIYFLRETDVLARDVSARLTNELNKLEKIEEVERRHMSLSNLLTGDILFGYKSTKLLKKLLISKIISTFTSSQVTHVMLALKSGTTTKMIDSAFMPNLKELNMGKVRMLDINVPPGEIWIVARPIMTANQRYKLLRSVVGFRRKKTEYGFTKASF